MKVREDFVTNSSSASYIICFARIADKEKAQKIIDKHELDEENIYDAAGVKGRMHWGTLGADWAGATIWGADDILAKHPDDNFVIVTGYNDADYDEDCEPVYNYDFDEDEIIADITEENGFTDIEVATGEGRDG